mmetsp:Transcript_8411/g.31146  ORF Transcript_8411/g.31146 Transcript_8411/m.31146 type:complete len:311 (+) Transcript_8411:64-996(+)
MPKLRENAPFLAQREGSRPISETMSSSSHSSSHEMIPSSTGKDIVSNSRNKHTESHNSAPPTIAQKSSTQRKSSLSPDALPFIPPTPISVYPYASSSMIYHTSAGGNCAANQQVYMQPSNYPGSTSSYHYAAAYVYSPPHALYSRTPESPSSYPFVLNNCHIPTLPQRLSLLYENTHKRKCNLFIFHLPADVTEENLTELFQKFGDVKSVHIPLHKETGLGKGYGFCQFVNQKDALRAMNAMNGYHWHNKYLRVKFKTLKSRGRQMRREQNGQSSQQNQPVTGLDIVTKDERLVEHPHRAQKVQRGEPSV